jgi:histidinol-phosphatase (PHP family)
MLPADGHVHTEWSWDALLGAMARTCARAVEIGLPAVAFTEHADLMPWTILGPEPEAYRGDFTDGRFTPRPLDVDGYLDCLDRCRHAYPGLRIRSGVELSEPHWHPEQVAALLARGPFDRVLGSVHVARHGDTVIEIDEAYDVRPAAEVIRDYLAEAARMIAGSDVFAVVAHLDYPFRSWPGGGGDPGAFEDEYRQTLRTLAGTGRALEVNTRLPMDPRIVRWWHEEGGDAVAFGSDAHDPDGLARGFADAAAMVESVGFRAGTDPDDYWRRSR